MSNSARFRRCQLITASVVIMFSIAIAASASAEVKPGVSSHRTTRRWCAILVSPGTYYKVQRGMTMKIIPSKRIDWPPPYKEATEKYSAQVRLNPDHRTLVGYVAGQPFPLLDSNDRGSSRAAGSADPQGITTGRPASLSIKRIGEAFTRFRYRLENE
jgi:hypothetical protein